MNFPDCITYRMEQRTDEWFAARKGVLTASNFGPWLLNTGKVAEAARERAICALIAERANCEKAPTFENWAMQRGTELEPQAIAAFEGETGLKVEQVGFCKSIHGAFGASPDGLIIGENAGIEIKVPIPENQIAYRRAGVIPTQYEFQVKGAMAVTGADRWHFFSWCPGLAPLRLVVERDETVDALRLALIEFSQQFEEAWTDECEAVAKYRKGNR